MQEPEAKKPSNRGSFLKRGMPGAGRAALGAGLLAKGLPAFADDDRGRDDLLTDGDAAILRLLAAAEIVESDLWQQRSELGGVQDAEVSGVHGGNPLYMGDLQILDGDLAQDVHDNTDDELSHAAFLNANLVSKGGKPVDLKRFRMLPSSKATGARQVKRLTNLTQLTVDTSFWTRYRSAANPDLGATFPEAVPSLNVGQHTAIPRSDADTSDRPSANRRPGRDQRADRGRALLRPDEGVH